jgi:hypothetical protein
MRVNDRGEEYSRDFYNVEMLETGMLCNNSIKKHDSAGVMYSTSLAGIMEKCAMHTL